jgi:hypothetical protein
MNTGTRVTTCRAVIGFVMLGIADAAAAQQPVQDILTFLVTNQSVSTGSIEERDRAAALATSQTISRALLANIATLPITSSSSAFVYRLNPELGTVQRTTTSFGPFFVERALTGAAHQASVGITYQHLRFTTLNGQNLRDGSLVTTANKFVDESEPFDIDQLTLNVDATVATLYANVGITDRLEVGAAAPMIDLRVDGARVETYRGRTFSQASASATAIGLGDVAIRGKYVIYSEHGSGIAAAADVRLPTGSAPNLLGAGTASVRMIGIGSYDTGRFTAHANGGVTIGGLARETNYGGAVTVEATPRVTVTGELLGRRIEGPGGIVQVSSPHPTLAGVETLRLQPNGVALNMLSFVPGVKWNVSSTWVLVANAAVPLTSAGLTSPITPFIGLDYSFGR